MSEIDYKKLPNTEVLNNDHSDDEKMNRGSSAWNDDMSFSDNDFEAPCPFIAEHCPYPCCCCCALSRSHRQQFALSMLYGKGYLVVYLLIIVMTLTLLVYDLARGNIIHDLHSEPVWFVIIDICTVSLMVFDVIVQVNIYNIYLCDCLYRKFAVYFEIHIRCKHIPKHIGSLL